MYKDTKKKIFDFVGKNSGATPGSIIAHFHLNAAGVFRHLKKLQKEKLVYKVGKPPSVRYFTTVPILEDEPELMTRAANWAVSGSKQWIANEEYCATRDVFHARSERMLRDFKKIMDENLAYLLIGVIEEIGNNSFDHNLGRWRDAPGVFFGLDQKTRAIVIADRGIGVFATLTRVRPKIFDDAEALRVAFTERVSGREPERRGNGLKFVKKVVEDNNIHLLFYSGHAMANIGKGLFDISSSPIHFPGTLASIHF